ncbi:Major facilitator-type transporter hxnP [Fusarium oxysporum f. sp. albedinis]|nr:Major facilitator-type transporter hxnP [Fusarium oxysporum f. sp. albedinis]
MSRVPVPPIFPCAGLSLTSTSISQPCISILLSRPGNDHSFPDPYIQRLNPPCVYRYLPTVSSRLRIRSAHANLEP